MRCNKVTQGTETLVVLASAGMPATIFAQKWRGASSG